MTYISIRPYFDEFVFFLDHNLRTPIPPKGTTSLNYQDQGSDRNNVGNAVGRQRLRPDDAATVFRDPPAEDENKNNEKGEQPEPDFESALFTLPDVNGFHSDV